MVIIFSLILMPLVLESVLTALLENIPDAEMSNVSFCSSTEMILRSKFAMGNTKNFILSLMALSPLLEKMIFLLAKVEAIIPSSLYVREISILSSFAVRFRCGAICFNYCC